MAMKLFAVVCLSCQAAAICVAPFPAARCAAARQPLNCAARRAAVSMATDTNTEDATAAFAAEAKRAAEAELTTPTIAELVEASFVRAVMDLRTGLVDTLKLSSPPSRRGMLAGCPLLRLRPRLAQLLGRRPAAHSWTRRLSFAARGSLWCT